MNTQLALYILDLSNSGQKLFSCLLHPKIVSEKVSGKNMEVLSMAILNLTKNLSWFYKKRLI